MIRKKRVRHTYGVEVHLQVFTEWLKKMPKTRQLLIELNLSESNYEVYIYVYFLNHFYLILSVRNSLHIFSSKHFYGSLRAIAACPKRSFLNLIYSETGGY